MQISDHGRRRVGFTATLNVWTSQQQKQKVLHENYILEILKI